MKLPLLAAGVLIASLVAEVPAAHTLSGGLGFYGIVERVVFEPADGPAERIQVWGAFAYADLGKPTVVTASRAERGYLYFKIRSDFQGFTTERQIQNNRREWADLKAIAGTGQAIGFGTWGYIGAFAGLDPKGSNSFLYENKPVGGERADLRVRPANETPANPATYQTEFGIVKLSDQGSHAAIVKQLRETLKR